MYSAGDRVREEEWLTEMSRAADSLDLGSDARSTAEDLYLNNVPDAERSKPAVAAAALYAGALIAGDERAQTAVADAMDVSRLSVQQRWKPLLEAAGFRTPSW
ncbi:transcription initiation factor IIB family protein [Halolamina litorea]|uniref:Transcription initiation factor IIB family protein n=1 Tax=Halolamina litorea TaxID=1515593 RepID=A0ABD6BRY5_9EURY|nr:transcription initiation factor IIB family protein [Halolamina litorea]